MPFSLSSSLGSRKNQNHTVDVAKELWQTSGNASVPKETTLWISEVA
jgi:hypothetical protein